MPSERYFEILVSRAPEIVFGAGFKLIAQQLTLPSGRVDLLLEDDAGTKHLVELKKDIAKPEAVRQVFRYLEDFRRLYSGLVCGWVVGNGISAEARTLAETCGVRVLAVAEADYPKISAAKGIDEAELLGDRIVSGVVIGGGVQNFRANGVELEAALSELDGPVRDFAAGLLLREGFSLNSGKMQIAVIYRGVKIGGINRGHKHIFISSNIVLDQQDVETLVESGFRRITKTQARSSHVHVYWKIALDSTHSADKVFNHFSTMIDRRLFSVP